MSEAQDKKLGPGAMVGGYRIERRLGQGGAGTVYAAEEPTIKKRVAIKVLRQALADDEGMALRFAREARAVNEIRHPGIIDVFAHGTLDDGRPYLVMSLLEGDSLRDALQRGRREEPAEAWRITREIAEALAAAHAAGVVHRDLKPDNVFLERLGGPEGAARAPRIRVLDFGIAKVETPDPDAEPMKLTATGVPIGTPAYMAPEQWWATGVSARTDQYALGAMLFEMLAGRPPFVSPQFVELAQLHVNQPPPALAAVGVAASEPVEALVARALAKSPDDRFASMLAVIEAGDRAFAGAALGPTPTVPDPEVAIVSLPATVVVTNTPELPLTIAPEAEPTLDLAEAVALRRYVSLHAAIVALGFAAVVAVGYAGTARHDVVEWIGMGGFGQWLIVLWSLFAAFALAVIARRRAATGEASNTGFWIALAPALQGAFSTYTGWRVILRSMGPATNLDALTIFSLGTAEANAARFFGFSVAALLFLSVAALPGVSGMAERDPHAVGRAGGAPPRGDRRGGRARGDRRRGRDHRRALGGVRRRAQRGRGGLQRGAPHDPWRDRRPRRARARRRGDPRGRARRRRRHHPHRGARGRPLGRGADPRRARRGDPGHAGGARRDRPPRRRLARDPRRRGGAPAAAPPAAPCPHPPAHRHGAPGHRHRARDRRRLRAARPLHGQAGRAARRDRRPVRALREAGSAARRRPRSPGLPGRTGRPRSRSPAT